MSQQTKYHAIVTFNLGKKFELKNNHNSKRKVVGECPLSGLFYARFCTDSTGAHHSTLVDGKTPKEILEKVKSLEYKVTRIEFIP